MALNEIEKCEIRRHLGFPAVAVNRWAQGLPAELRSYRINATLEDLEERLCELDVIVEAKLSGKCIGLVQVVAKDPAEGDQVSVTVFSQAIAGGSETVTATAATGDTKYALAAKLCQAFAQNVDLAAAKFSFSGPFNISQANANLLPQVVLRCPTEFTMTCTFTGQSAISIEAQGEFMDPRAVVGKSLGIEIIKYGYIPILSHLEGAIAGVTRNADVARAGEYVRGFELRERQKLYGIWQSKLADFLGFSVANHQGGMVL